MIEQTLIDFDGKTYNPTLDKVRLNKQLTHVFQFMKDGLWHTLFAVSTCTGYPEASISARLRDLRKDRFGAHTVERRRRTDGGGTWEYRLVVNQDYELELTY